MTIQLLRNQYHERLIKEIIRIQKGRKDNQDYPNFSDGSSKASVQIAWSIINTMGCSPTRDPLKGQETGDYFEEITKDFLEEAFNLLKHIRPGKWDYSTNTPITRFDQYSHLADLEEIIEKNNLLASALGKDYIISPDIVIGRWPLSDEEINQESNILIREQKIVSYSPLREENQNKKRMILHASISCKWTLRSDRGQNARTEALNLIRNRKGHLPHVVAVTAEPLPTRIASLALGTGDLDCVYHFALPELIIAIEEVKNEDQADMLDTLINGRRLRDISDLPFDLAI